jgi:Rieske [2Fe-2S] domain
MFKNPPKILTHISALDMGSMVTPEYIISKNNFDITLLRRFCPHRMYPIGNVGEILKNKITCKFHGFEWNTNGEPINNDRKISCGTAKIGRSGLILKDFVEPNHRWVTDLAKETNLKFSHIREGKSVGSWLWMMEIQADLLHVRAGDDVIHPWLSAIENLEDVELDSGDGWVIQTCSTGWWLFIYPFTFIEWSPGCLSINYTIPDNINSEFGFTWVTQFYYNSEVTRDRRVVFEKLEDALHEDIKAIEAQRGPYFPLTKASNRLEDHCVHFGKWVTDNKLNPLILEQNKNR